MTGRGLLTQLCALGCSVLLTIHIARNLRGKKPVPSTLRLIAWATFRESQLVHDAKVTNNVM